MVSRNIALKCFIYFLVVAFTTAKNEDYMGYKVYNIKLTTESQQDDLLKLKSDMVDFWRKPCAKYNVKGRAMVPPSHIDWFEQQLKEIAVEKDIFTEDLYTYLTEREQQSRRSYRERENDIDSDERDNDESDEGNHDSDENDNIIFDFDGYYRYDVILAHLYALEDAFSNSTTSVTVVVYGQTEENRPLVYLKLTNANETDKPVAVIESAINPRDWITVPSALNVVNRLLEDENRRFLEDVVWIVVPVLNPDGYEYTHTNLRLWTKSRSLRSNLGFICPGVNINRNFDVAWQISDSSSSPCSHVYAGIEAFSEIETRMIKHIIDEYSPTLYISLQNSGKFVTYPWRYEKAASGLFRRHYIEGLDIIDALDGYTLDSGAIAIGDRESETSVDYARLNSVFYTYNVGIDGDGNDGVIVPEEDIRTIADDVWRAVATAARSLTIY